MYHRASDADVPAVVALMNRAYRGTGSEVGWASDGDYLAGARTTAALLRADVSALPAASLLVWREADAAIIGCVWLEPLGREVWYLGSLAIDPGAQNGGLGRRLLAEAEGWVAARGGRRIRIGVVNVRAALLAWYTRRGYRPTGETEPFPYGDDRFGVPLRDDLEFIVLAKELAG